MKLSIAGFIALLRLNAVVVGQAGPPSKVDFGGADVTPIPISELRGPIGVNTQYLTEEASITKWIGVDTNILTRTVQVIPATTGKPKATVTADVNIAITTNGAGDLIILTGPALRRVLQETYDKVPKCATSPQELGPRDDVPLCGFNAFLKSAFELDVITEVGSVLNRRLLIKPNDISHIIAQMSKAVGIGGKAGLVVKVDPAKISSMFGKMSFGAALAANGIAFFRSTVSLLTTHWYLLHEGEKLPESMKVPKYSHRPGPPPEEKRCFLDAEKSVRPVCVDTYCDSKNDRFCTSERFKGCKCLPTPDEHGIPRSKEWIEKQASWLFGAPPPTQQIPAGLGCNVGRARVLPVHYKRLVATFCAPHSLGVGMTMNKMFTAREVGIRGYEGYQFIFIWHHMPKACPQSCEEIYMAFSDYCRLAEQMPLGGSFTQACGTAIFSINIE